VRSITQMPVFMLYKEILINERLVYSHETLVHFDEHFLVTILFPTLESNQTIVNMIFDFPDENQRNQVLSFFAVERGNQTLGRPENYLKQGN